MLCFNMTAILIGLIIYSYFKLCDPMATGELMSFDQVNAKKNNSCLLPVLDLVVVYLPAPKLLTKRSLEVL